MKVIIEYLLFSVIVLLGISAQRLSAQTYIDEEPLVLENERLSQAALSEFGLLNTPNTKNQELQENEIFLKQIGDYNEVSVNTQTNASEIKINQYGSSNWTTIDYTVNTAVANFIQNGSLNTIHDYVNQPEADISLELTQEGTGKYFERNGVNDLTKSIRFIQTDATPVLIINSYK